MKAISERFPPRFLAAATYVGSNRYTIRETTEEKFQTGEQLCLWFREIPQGYVLRRQDNAKRLAAGFGDDPAAWAGGQVTLVAETLSSGTKSIGIYVDGRFQAEHRPPTPEEAAVAAQAPLDDDLDDSIDDLFEAPAAPAAPAAKGRKKS
jgi:hypothetical protein